MPTAFPQTFPHLSYFGQFGQSYVVAFVVTAVVDVGVIDDDVDIVVVVAVVVAVVVVGYHWLSLVIIDKEEYLPNPHRIFQILPFSSVRGRL